MPADPELEARIDALYAAPREAFTAARDALAKELRGAGARERAAEVKALRKPSVAAWALNRVRRDAPDRVEALLEAGAALRDAQQRLLAGDAAGLREAGARERELVEELTERAVAALDAAGHPATAAVRGQLFDTLHAACGDDRARDGLAAGQLVGEHRLDDLGFALAGIDAGAEARATPRASASPGTATKPTKKQAAAGERELAAARERLSAAETAVAREREAVGSAEAAAQQAEEAVTDAEEAVADAERRLADARAERDGAARAAERARADLAAAEAELKADRGVVAQLEA